MSTRRDFMKIVAGTAAFAAVASSLPAFAVEPRRPMLTIREAMKGHFKLGDKFRLGIQFGYRNEAQVWVNAASGQIHLIRYTDDTFTHAMQECRSGAMMSLKDDEAFTKATYDMYDRMASEMSAHLCPFCGTGNTFTFAYRPEYKDAWCYSCRGMFSIERVDYGERIVAWRKPEGVDTVVLVEPGAKISPRRFSAYLNERMKQRVDWGYAAPVVL